MSDPVLAVVDIGSNSIKILVVTACANLSGGSSLRVLFQKTLETRISGGLGQERSQLGEIGISAGLRAITRLLDLAAPYSPTHRCIVATSAVRDASNRDDFSARVQAIAGAPLEILTGEEEALLIARGIQTDPALAGTSEFCIMDLGGGSLECIRYRAGQIEQGVSLQLGAVRLTEKFVPNPALPFSQSARTAIAEESQKLFAASGFHFISGGKLVGCGGAYTVCRAIFAHRRGFTAKEDWPAVINRVDFSTLLEEISPLTSVERSRIPCLPPQRADIMPAALTTILTLLDQAGSDRVLHSFHNLRFGVAARFFAQLGHGG